MKQPQEYVDFLDRFLDSESRKVKVDGVNREDWACLVTAAHILELPVDVLLGKNTAKGSVYLVRKDTVGG